MFKLSVTAWRTTVCVVLALLAIDFSVVRRTRRQVMLANQSNASFGISGRVEVRGEGPPHQVPEANIESAMYI